MNYYNEFDPKTAAWLRELIKIGAIPDGHVDERSIADVSPSDLKGYVQCHFFAGIGGWSLALRLAGWPEDRPVWTGSCPCQPFSVAGRGRGTDDERHLWPVFAELIRACKPATVFGEQVASKAGRDWLGGVFADLEGMGYSRAGADLCAAGVGAPHIRQRLYWVAYDSSAGLERATGQELQRDGGGFTGSSEVGGWQRVSFAADCFGGDDGEFGDICSVCGNDYVECGCPGPTQEDEFEYVERDGILYARRLVNVQQSGLQGLTQSSNDWGQSRRVGKDSVGSTSEASFWIDAKTIHCRDGKTRRIPTEPAFHPLAHGVPARVVRLRGYGNAIVPQVAAEFIKASVEAVNNIQQEYEQCN